MNHDTSYGARQAQPVDQLQNQMAANGWDFFAAALAAGDGAERDRLVARLRDEQAALARAAARMFATDEGRAFLEFLADTTVRRPMSVFGMSVEQSALYAHFREGQNSLFMTILKMIAAGRDEKAPQREGN